MRPTLRWGAAVLAALCAPCYPAANPDDLNLVLRLTRDPAVFHAGEPIEFEISYSTHTDGKYRGTWTNPSPELGVVTLHLSPSSNLVELQSLQEAPSAGSILSGIGNLDPRYPVIQKADLSDWYRFENGGHYELRVSSPQVSRIKSAQEGGGLEPVTLESNSIEFDVLPRDAAWESQELVSALHDLDAGPPLSARAIHRLVLLDTPGSVRNLVSLFFDEGGASASGSDSYWIYRGLQISGHPEVIIPLLEDGIENPLRSPNSNVVELLAGMQVRRDFGPPPALPEDPARKKEWEDGWAKRNKASRDYRAQATEKLVASVRRRSGPQRNAALFQAWRLAEGANNPSGEASAALVQLRQEVLACARELPLEDLMGFVAEVWNRKSIPREQVLPLIRYLALSAGRTPKDQSARLQFDAYPLWCEESPRECSEAILADAAKPDSPLLPNTILLMKESEHPELDASLTERLAAVAKSTDNLGIQETGALVLRAGSRNLQPVVKAALAQLAGGRPADCEIQAYLLNYQFRFAPKDAAQYLSTAFHDKENSCRWLAFLGQTRYSDDLIPVAIAALDSPNSITAASGALFLGVHGSPDAEETLWRHLDAFWEQWRHRAADLQNALPGLSGPAAAAQLEQSLVNALVRGANWKLTLAEEDRLREGCLTDDCRRIAAREMSLGY